CIRLRSSLGTLPRERIEFESQRAAHCLAGQGDAIPVANHADIILVAEIIVEILDAGKEVARESPFDSATDRPAVIFPAAVRRRHEIDGALTSLKLGMGGSEAPGCKNEPVGEGIADATAHVACPAHIVKIGRSRDAPDRDGISRSGPPPPPPAPTAA